MSVKTKGWERGVGEMETSSTDMPPSGNQWERVQVSLDDGPKMFPSTLEARLQKHGLELPIKPFINSLREG